MRPSTKRSTRRYRSTFAAFGVDAVYPPAGGEPVSVRVIARRPDTIVGFGETRIHAETATFEVRPSDVADPRPGDQLAVGAETLVVRGEPERRDPERLVWTLDVRRSRPTLDVRASPVPVAAFPSTTTGIRLDTASPRLRAGTEPAARRWSVS
jgi:hypothetical protein